MKLLLNEELRKLRYQLRPEHEVLIVQDMGWRGKRNGEVLKLLVEHQFEAFLTTTKRNAREQN